MVSSLPSAMVVLRGRRKTPKCDYIVHDIWNTSLFVPLTSLISILTSLLVESNTSFINRLVLISFISYAFVDFNVDFCLKLAYIDEVCNCEFHMFIEVVESTCKVQFLSELSVKSFIPIIIFIFHSDEAFK